MSVEQIKRDISVVSDTELGEVTAYLFHLRHRNDPDYEQAVEARSSDQDKTPWLTPDEFEQASRE